MKEEHENYICGIDKHRNEIDCRTTNEASSKVIEKCVLTYERTFLDFFWRMDQYEGRA